MDEKEQKVITFKLSVEEAEKLDAEANAAELSRSDYLRKVLFTPSVPSNGKLEDLIKHAIYTINQVHTALYSVAEAEGKAARFLSTEELRDVYKRVRVEAIRYALEFPQRFDVVQAEIAAAAQNGAK
jgi:hypothetical protein